MLFRLQNYRFGTLQKPTELKCIHPGIFYASEYHHGKIKTTTGLKNGGVWFIFLSSSWKICFGVWVICGLTHSALTRKLLLVRLRRQSQKRLRRADLAVPTRLWAQRVPRRMPSPEKNTTLFSPSASFPVCEFMSQERRVLPSNVQRPPWSDLALARCRAFVFGFGFFSLLPKIYKDSGNCSDCNYYQANFFWTHRTPLSIGFSKDLESSDRLNLENVALFVNQPYK